MLVACSAAFGYVSVYSCKKEKRGKKRKKGKKGRENQ
jgi:hypothetical protein